jgi:sulfatase maturation enzyme AslB (radical SAM superfamily)
MLAGEAIPECSQCYKIEETGGGSLRKDLLSRWNREKHDQFQQIVSDYQSGKPLDGPVSVEVRTGSICNLKCRMCSPNDSVLIEKEYNKLDRVTVGEWKTLSFFPGSSHVKHDKYFHETVKNFQNIEVLRFSGGEPFLNDSTNDLIAEAAKSGHSKHIDLFVNTNFTRITPKLLDDMSTFKTVNIDISLDGYKGVHEYIRSGLSWDTIEANMEMIKPYLSQHFYLTTNTTVQNLNVLYLEEVLKWTICDLKITPILCVLTGPSWLSVQHMPDAMKEEAISRINSIIRGSIIQEYKFPNWLIGRLTAILDAIKQPSAFYEIEKFQFFTQMTDIERGQDIHKSLPEVAAFYNAHKSPNQHYDGKNI